MQDRGKESVTQIIKLITNTQYIIDHQIVIDIIDFLVDKSQIYFQSLISGKQFLTALLNLLKNSKNAKQLQLKILELIKKWGTLFESKKDIMPNFFETYKALKDKGCDFPNEEKLVGIYKQYIGNEEQMSENININKEEQNIINQHQNNKAKNNYGDINLDLNPLHYPKELQLFVTEIPSLLEYVLLDNELIDNFVKEGNKKEIDISIVELTQNIQDLSITMKK